MLSPVFTEYQGKRLIFFSSPHSDNGCLSNWYESPFSMGTHNFDSAEQAFLYLKALSSGDEATALRVFAMDEPRYFARLNKQIRPFDARRWAEQRESSMRRIVREKFTQSEELTEFLLATGDATIVNCSRNPLWSCGLQMTQVERLDRERWLGQNLLGTMLMELREELRPAEPEPAAPTAESEPVTKAATVAAAAPAAEPEPAAEAAPDAAAESKQIAAPLPEVTPEDDSSDSTAPSTSTDEPSASAAATDDANHTAPAEQLSPDATSSLSVAPPAPQGDGPQQGEASQGQESPSDTGEPATAQPNAARGESIPSADTQTEAAEAPVDVEETQLIPNPNSADETTVIPSAARVGRVPEATPAPQPNPAPDAADPLVARYAQGDYPTADELADGSILKHLIVSFTQENSAAVRQALMQCLRDSVVAVTATKVDPLVASTAPVRDDGLSDPLIMDNGSTYRPSILENDAGQRWFPTFSSVTEISSELSGQASVIMLPMSQCVELARTHGGLAGIVVNVFSENLILPGRTCDYIAGLPSHLS